jgi:hypothetical protein
VDHEVIADLQSQIQRFRYRNPMDIRNLLNYPEEQITSYTPNLDSIIEDHLEEAGLAPMLYFYNGLKFGSHMPRDVF